MHRGGEEGIILLVVCGDLVLTAIGSLHHECFVGISTEKGDVIGSKLVLVEGVDVGLEAIGLVTRVEVDGDASGRHTEMI